MLDLRRFAALLPITMFLSLLLDNHFFLSRSQTSFSEHLHEACMIMRALVD